MQEYREIVNRDTKIRADHFPLEVCDERLIVRAAKSVNKGKAGLWDGIPDCLLKIS